MSEDVVHVISPATGPVRIYNPRGNTGPTGPTGARGPQGITVYPVVFSVSGPMPSNYASTHRIYIPEAMVLYAMGARIPAGYPASMDVTFTIDGVASSAVVTLTNGEGHSTFAVPVNAGAYVSLAWAGGSGDDMTISLWLKSP